ncbi:MAG: oxygen-dependent coproporphyrinogen oxidase, partial [Candidatus Marinimicrobia bacterium]|nr:oxygen-dependent coproporphyrinogen oxidase [Candidatus Neomarinimicrobiota bacterium]
MNEEIPQYFKSLQDLITSRLETIDGKQTFHQDSWLHKSGGGGRTRVLSEGAVFEKAGVSFSEVHGDKLPDSALEKLPDITENLGFSATGISLIIHPLNPHVPTVHMNYRYFESGDTWWFGGGADLTPYYPYREDVIHFHRTLKNACDKSDETYYPKFKKWCDEYFYIQHRDEPRGVGGIFFDHLSGSFNNIFSFVRDCGDNFLPAYEPIVIKRKDLSFNESQREFQLYRRGRYVEFNLVYDRGTKFGLQTGGRIESILVSMPPLVKWKYDYQPEPGSREAELY